MKILLPLLPWLVFAGLADWLITRTLTRLAIFIPKPEAVLPVYQGLTGAGQLAATLSGLLALVILGGLAWSLRHTRSGLPASFILAGALVFSLVFLIVPPSTWSGLVYQGLLFGGVAWLGWRAFSLASKPAAGLAIGLAVLALLSGRIYHALPPAVETLGLTGPAQFATAFFNLGEALAVAAAFTFWFAYGRSAPWRYWIIALLPVGVFVGLRLANPSMAGILAIWSTGFTLYLPWPVYALGLWLVGVTVMVSRLRGDVAWMALLLLCAGGYAPQLSAHAFFGLIALWLLGDGRRELGIRKSELGIRNRESLACQRTSGERPPVRLVTFDGHGLLPGVVLDDSASLLDVMESADFPD
jgi:hypothetical protein